jgi:hypothetical protein
VQSCKRFEPQRTLNSAELFITLWFVEEIQYVLFFQNSAESDGTQTKSLTTILAAAIEKQHNSNF